MNNKIVSTKTNAIFLATLLVLGTIATISSSFIVGAQADSYYDGMDSYKKSNGKDVSVKNVKCNNVNVNVNGLDLNLTSVPFLSNLLASETHADEGERGSNSYGSGGSYGDKSRSDGDFKFICINNNNNTVVVGEEPIPEPGPLTCEECFTSILNPEELDDLIQATTLPDSLPELCNEFIEGGLQTEQGRTFISEYLFTSGMTALISVDKINAILDCLEEVYGVDFPRP